MDDESVHNDFFSGRRSDRAPFCVNDAVEITDGQFAGRSGAVVSLVADGQEYLVELDDGTDALVSRSHLHRAPDGISIENLLDLVERELAECSRDLQLEFARHRIAPERWSTVRWGAFWAVALHSDRVLWYNDIEEGFNVSRFDSRGVIPSGEYWCNEDRLSWVIERLLANSAD